MVLLTIDTMFPKNEYGDYEAEPLFAFIHFDGWRMTSSYQSRNGEIHEATATFYSFIGKN